MERCIIIILFFITVGMVPSCTSAKEVNTDSSTAKEERVDINGYVLKFNATGHEPEWTVEISQQQILYKNINLAEPIVFNNVRSNQIMDIPGVGYTGVGIDGQKILVEVKKTRCEDSMDDQVYSYNVNVQMDDGSERALKGCGSYVLDERLGKTWYMVSFKGNQIEIINADKRPLIKFDLKHHKLNANMGCNGIGGSYEVMENHIYFDPNFMSTQMYCEGAMELEKSFSNLISGKTVVYKFEGERLIFSDLNGVELAVFAQ